jgi:acyl transferase domain-containing protein/NAD(P)-dependent dehydrogenase (short-subunit alcohol dehydrogenase family)
MASHSTTPVPVAIIGIGCLFPKAADHRAYWANILSRVDAITDVPPDRWDPADYFDADAASPDRTYARRGGFLDPVAFKPLEFGITPNSLGATDSAQLLGLVAARAALEDAGYGAGREFDRGRISVFLGVTGTQQLVIPLGARLGHPIWRRALHAAGVEGPVADEVVRRIADAYVGWQEDSFPGLLGNVVAGRIANRLNLHGTNCVVDAACASSLGALHLALLELGAGRCDLALSGGVDTFNDIFMYLCFSKTPALSPTGDARPFDAGADGTILGEGLGCVLLKRLGDAERDGDRIYAVIRAVGSSSDGKGHAIYAPSPDGQTRALRRAYELAGFAPATVELVEAHGTGTRAGDAAEAAALTEVFQAARSPGTWCALGSVKSQIGHTKAAAGAAGLIKAALALHHKVLPPTIKVSQPAETLAECDTPFYVNTDKRPWLPGGAHPRRAAVSSFGFGGSNYHCVLEEYCTNKTEIDWDGDVQLVALAAESPDALRSPVKSWCQERAWPEVRTAARASRVAFRADAPCRLVLALQRGQDLARLGSQILSQLGEDTSADFWSLPDGVYFGRSRSPGKLALLFPGQGSQYPGMLRDLACQFPQMLEALRGGNACFAQDQAAEASSRLSDFIYPQPAFHDEVRRRQADQLMATAVAQPALGAVSLGAWHILEHFAVRPDAVAGHSFGELTALCAAGRLTPEHFLALAVLRGRLMRNAASTPGGMLAVPLAVAEAADFLSVERLPLVIANRNAPRQTVLSGAVADIERAATLLQQQGVAAKRLPVAAAFHSPLIASVEQPMLAALQPLPPGRVPVFANTTASPYPAEPELARRQLARQLAEPVLFHDTIDNLYAAGVRTFVEVGPGARLTGLVRAILQNRPHQAAALDASAGQRAGQLDLARLLALLAVLCYPVALTRWDDVPHPDEGVTKESAGTVWLTGANYRAPVSEVRSKPAAPQGQAPVPSANGKDHPLECNGSPPVSNKGAVLASHSRVTTTAPSVMNEPTSPGASLTAAPDQELTPQSLNLIQQQLRALQQLSEQTAQLHRQFLDGQDRALQVFQSLLQQQQALLAAPAGAAAANGRTQCPPMLPPRRTESEARAEPIATGGPPRGATGAARIGPQPKPIPAPPAARHSSPPTARDGVTNGQPVPPAPVPEAAAILLGVVAEKTGYPVEMLGLEMELDADLGIDSIKRVEIFSALQERLPHAPAIQTEHIAALRTLGDVVRFLQAGSAHTQVNGTPGPITAPPEPVADLASTDAADILLQVVAEKTGYPAEMLALGMELDADLGIDSIKRVEIFSALQERLPHAPMVGTEQMPALRTLGEVVAFLANGTTAQKKNPAPRPRPLSPVDTVADAPAPSLALPRYTPRPQPLPEFPQRPHRPLPQGGDVWIIGADALAESLAERCHWLGYAPRLSSLEAAQNMPPDAVAAVVLLAPVRGTDGVYLGSALELLRQLGPTLRAGAEQGGAALLAVSRLDGGFGLWPSSDLADPVSGGLSGLVKTAAREWPAVRCKTLDIAPALDAEEAALAIAAELETDGPVEVGVNSDGLVQLRLEPVTAASSAAPVLRPGDLLLVSGGARGITAEVAVELAQCYAPTLILLGRSPEPGPEPDWMAGVEDPQQIKQLLFQHAGTTLSPKDLERHYRELLAGREIRRNLQRIEAAGATVHYRQADVRDASVMRALVADLRRQFGPVQGLLHGAGVIADRRIEDKTPEQFRAVYDTKVSGLLNLLAAVEQDPLAVLMLFSSSTARFGRVGQADYAAANEVLNKLAQVEARRRPACRVVSLNWGPWAGGMVNDGLRQTFAAEGIDLIPLAAGARLVADLLAQAEAGPVEQVVLAGELPAEPGPPPLTMTPANRPATLTRAFTREVSLETCPVLASHVLGGRAVMPLVLHLEWLAHGAAHANPGLLFHGFDDLRILQGVKLAEGQNCTLQILTEKPARAGEMYRVPVAIQQQTAAGDRIVHAQAAIWLTANVPAAPPAAATAPGSPYQDTMAEAYAARLFHGPALQGIRRIESVGPEGITGVAATAPAPGRWLQRPLRGAWWIDPLVLDTSFQLMVLWCWENHDMPLLPTALARYRQYCRTFPAGEIRVVARVTRQTGQHVLADIDYLDAGGRLLARLEGGECIRDESLKDSFRRNQLLTPAHSN